jgi:uncharacterized protein (DUF2249 family)
MISGDMTVARLIEEHPALLDVLIAYHPHFKQLRNRLLRKLMAPRVTIRHAARIAGVPEAELLGALRRSLGEAAGEPTVADHPEAPFVPMPKPPFLDTLPESRRVPLDVRDDIGRGQEPFARIMATVRELGAGDVLVLRAPFEPIPLYDVLGKRGFGHWTERHRADDWSVWFYRVAAGGPKAPAPVHEPAGPDVLQLDVRGLEPPQPMVRVLEALDTLGPGQRLEVVHDRRPLFLYPQLDAQGFVHETEEPGPGLVRITIRRRQP